MSRRVPPLIAVLAAIGALFILVGGAIHLREWFAAYLDVPWSIDGAWVVKVGFPVDAALSVALAAVLAFVVLRPRPLVQVVAAFVAALAFQVGALIALFVSRTDSGLLGWSEPRWTSGATQARFVEVVAVTALAGALALLAIEPQER